MVAATQRQRRRNNVLKSPERLEARTVLSASPMSLEVDLAIVGTDVQFSPMGLPSSMSGDIYLSGNSASKVGRYSEVLTPIFMDINNDLQPDFVGTTGVSTFSITVGGSQQWSLGSLVTSNTSLIQGVTQFGEMLVGSLGTITASTGLLRGAAGSFQSQSTVALYPSFSMQTVVHFSIDLTSNVIAGGLRQLQKGSEPETKNTKSDSDDAISDHERGKDKADDEPRGNSPLSDRQPRVHSPRELPNRIPDAQRGRILRDALDHRFDSAVDGLFA